MRREFSKFVKREAFRRAGGFCEGMPYGRRCDSKLQVGRFHYDHVIPDGLGGDPDIENCAVLCIACHKDKTGKQDIPAIAKTKRIQDRHNGIRKASTMKSRGFDKQPPQRTASRPIVRWAIEENETSNDYVSDNGQFGVGA